MARRAAQCAFRSVAASTRSVLAPVRSAVAMPSRGPSVQCVSSTARHFATDIQVTFVTPSGDEIVVSGDEGDSLLELAHENDIDIEGACGGECACSTCHVILDEKEYELLDEPDEEEEDMLDLALGLTDTSRLGCQVFLSADLHGMRVTLPAETANFLDG